ncbi:hypothetical protein NQ315_002556 [Exocentrus adspersus]|uniref:Uncharacterized protein n=1 Tax=Exocentrus adspersus TaxID=1586481 RepID=A0AAV8VF57_9CUCU|nr:hypothetical protein NQ315_002556 [Exocentrus adspersus]
MMNETDMAFVWTALCIQLVWSQSRQNHYASILQDSRNEPTPDGNKSQYFDKEESYLLHSMMVDFKELVRVSGLLFELSFVMSSYLARSYLGGLQRYLDSPEAQMLVQFIYYLTPTRRGGLQHHNRVYTDIKMFTTELKKDSNLPFLDVIVSRRPDGILGYSLRS